jgi:hypothetical protein
VLLLLLLLLLLLHVRIHVAQYINCFKLKLANIARD